MSVEAAGFNLGQLERELNFAINKISERKIFSTDQYEHREVLDQIRRRASVFQKKTNMINWLEEFSDNRSSSFAPKGKRRTEEAATIPNFKYEASIDMNADEDSDSELSSSKKATSIRSLYQEYERIEALLNSPGDLLFNSREFDLFKFTDIAGRDKTLPLLSVHMFLAHNLIQYVNEQKLSKFLCQVQRTYRRDVQYHNDLHGIDVAHMAHLFLTQGGLKELAELDHIDTMAFLVGAVCHDLGHDGFTNTYHSNSVTDRAIRYNDLSIQENYHVAESFNLIQRSDMSFLESLTADEFKVFRKRMIGCILATDMAKHASDLSALKSLVEAKQIRSGTNAKLALNKESDASLFKSQQFLLEMCLHSCDLSQQTRPFPTAKNWTYLLYEEFFNQGDLERSSGLPISFLCDRNATKINTSQPGFINGITVPLWVSVCEIMPHMQPYLQGAKDNAVTWETYEETEEDKRSYKA